jgi:hypothetical protein
MERDFNPKKLPASSLVYIYPEQLEGGSEFRRRARHMTVDIDAVVRRTSVRAKGYVDGKPALEIHVLKSNAANLPIKEGSAVEIELTIGQHIWHAKVRSTPKNKYVWISPKIEDSQGKRHRLVDALGTGYQPNERVVLRTNGYKVQVL